MFDLGFGELLFIGIVALIVVGPKDLPGMFRSVGRFMGKARGMAREFSRAMEAAADESGVKDIQKTLKAAANPGSFATDGLKRATGLKDAPDQSKPTPAEGSETAKLSAERAAAREKVLEATARAASARKARDTAVTEGDDAGTDGASGPATASPTATPTARPSETTKQTPARREGEA